MPPSLCSATREATAMRSPSTGTTGWLSLSQLEQNPGSREYPAQPKINKNEKKQKASLSPRLFGALHCYPGIVSRPRHKVLPRLCSATRTRPFFRWFLSDWNGAQSGPPGATGSSHVTAAAWDFRVHSGCVQRCERVSRH